MVVSVIEMSFTYAAVLLFSRSYANSDWLLCRAFSNLLDRGSDNRSSILRVREFKVHSPANKAQLQHRAAPSRTCNIHLGRLRTVFRVSADQHLAASQGHSRVAVVSGLNLQHRGR